MPHGEVTKILRAPSEVVFDLIHDYSRRLEWDTLLQAAYLEDGHLVPAMGVTSVCLGRRALGGFALRTVYFAFHRPSLAAVKMLNNPPFFESWAASIRHQDISSQESQITYKFHFTTRPSYLRFILDPLMEKIFIWETKKRLDALNVFIEREQRKKNLV